MIGSIIRSFLLRHLPTWKTVTVGDLGDGTTVRQRLGAVGIKTDHFYINETLKQVPFADTKKTYRIVQVKLRQLGLKPTAKSVAEIYDTARCSGLTLCPAEVAIQLWLQHPDMFLTPLYSNLLYVAMEPIRTHNHRGVFVLLHLKGEDRRLVVMSSENAFGWKADTQWLFVRES